MPRDGQAGGGQEQQPTQPEAGGTGTATSTSTTGRVPMAPPSISAYSSTEADEHATFSSRNSLASSTRYFPLRSVKHPSANRPSLARTLSPSYSDNDLPPCSPTASNPPPAFVAATTAASDPRSLTDVLPEPPTVARIKEEDASVKADVTASRGGTSYTSGVQHITSRFEHTVGEGGEHLVLTGREGELQRCEDEPIHAPGAIQSFGALIAFDQQEDGRLVVQQVSENSRFIIGHSPSNLFRLNCLTAIFSEEEADVLLDHLDNLDDRDADPSDLDASPVTFTLSGEGQPGTDTSTDAHASGRLEWTAHCALHRPDRKGQPQRAVLELELVDDLLSVPRQPGVYDERLGMPPTSPEDEGSRPSPEELAESTISLAKPLRALARLRKRAAGGRRTVRDADVDVVALLGQINEQLNRAEDLQVFLKTVAAIFRDLTEFDRCMIYSFDSDWNGQVVAEQVDWNTTRDLFAGLNFPASDIPVQARELYKINKVRLLHDRDQPTARLVCRNAAEVANPLDMTHAHLRAMSPIHIKYLGNMGVRSSMSISICAFGDLYGLVALHHYGKFGHRVSFPIRQLCRLLGESISRNIERISYARRIHSRKLINTTPTASNPSGYIVANSDDLLALFDADFGVLSIGEEAKILGEVSNSQELFAVLDYLRGKQHTTIVATRDVNVDWSNIDYPRFEMIAGVLSVPLSSEGKDFIAMFRLGQLQEVKWAGNPYANKTEGGADYNPLEPRRSFKTWSEMVVGRCRAWTDEQMEVAGVLALVYGKFIDVWRAKEDALAKNKLNAILLANASHEVRTPLNAIINYLELALDSDLAPEIRANLASSHAASRSLVHVVNDLLDLTRTERGNDLFLSDPFNLSATIDEAIAVHKGEAERQGLTMEVMENPSGTPTTLLGDRAKIKTIITNVLGNAVQHTETGGIMVEWGELADADVEDAVDKKQDSIRIGISITDTGVGISDGRLEAIFREFEQVSTTVEVKQPDGEEPTAAVGLGLAVVARVVRNLGGQLRVESKTEQGKSGTKFTFVLPFRLPSQQTIGGPSFDDGEGDINGSGTGSSRTLSGLATSASYTGTSTTRATTLVRTNSGRSTGARSAGSSKEGSIDSLITSLSSSVLGPQPPQQMRQASYRSNRSYGSTGNGSGGTAPRRRGSSGMLRRNSNEVAGQVEIESSAVPLKAVKVPPLTGSPTLGSGQWSGYNSSPNSSIKDRSPPTSSVGSGSTSRRASASASSMSLRLEGSAGAGAGPSVHGSTAQIPSIPEKQSPTHVSEYRKVGDGDEKQISPMRVLVVEDELVNRMILQKRLSKDGHTVEVALNGKEALRRLEEESFDVILMDLMMPIMGGLEATIGIRQREVDHPLPHARIRPSTLLNGRVPVIAVSASLPESNRGQIVDAGFDGWCLKPVDVHRLRTIMRGALDISVRNAEVYVPGLWEQGGWLEPARPLRPPAPPKRPSHVPSSP